MMFNLLDPFVIDVAQTCCGIIEFTCTKFYRRTCEMN